MPDSGGAQPRIGETSRFCLRLGVMRIRPSPPTCRWASSWCIPLRAGSSTCAMISDHLRARPLRDLGHIFEALERLPVPTFAVGRDMTIRWLNAASRELVGDRVGERFTNVLEAGSVSAAKQAFAKKLVGTVASTEYDVTLRKRDGTLVRAEISSVPVHGDRSIA